MDGKRTSSAVLKISSLMPLIFQLQPGNKDELPPPIRKKVIIFEVEGGTDKGPDGHRKDTMPIVAALQRRGWDAEVLYYTDANRYELEEKCLAGADAFLSRINPGTYEGYTEAEFMSMARSLHSAGCHALQHPDVMLSYGAKDSLVKLRDIATGLPDTYCYYDLESIQRTLPSNLLLHDRVLKQNRGSAGEGIWVVKPHGWERGEGARVDAGTLVSCTEMKNNSNFIYTLGEFMERCQEYVVGDSALLVDQRFLPRIVEGEVRVFMIYDTPVTVVHKKPAEGQMSATLFSGARYTYDPASDPKWQSLLADWIESLPHIRARLGGLDYPLIWTADFILDTNRDGSDAYRLGELNASCVGFTTHLDLANMVADSIIKVVTKARAHPPPAEPAAAVQPPVAALALAVA